MTFIFNLLFIVLLTSLSYGTQKEPVTPHKDLRKISHKIESNKKIIEKKRKEKKKFSYQLGYLKRKLRIQKRTLRKQNRELTYINHQKEATEKAIQTLKKQQESTLKQLTVRLRAMYTNQDLGFLGFLFSPTQYLQVIENSHYFEKIMEKDITLINKVIKEHEALTQQQKILSTKKQKTASLNQALRVQKQSIELQSRKINTHVLNLQSQIKKFEDENNILSQDSSQIESLIQKGSKKHAKSYFAIGSYIKPTKGWLSSVFGRRKHPIFKRYIMHTGIDLAAPSGRRIIATNSGYVLFSGWKKGYGNTIIINHGWKKGVKYSSVYAHQSRRVVRKGHYVKKGQLIGYVGSTGYSTGPHLHFEIRKNGRPTNPLNFIRI